MPSILLNDPGGILDCSLSHGEMTPASTYSSSILLPRPPMHIPIMTMAMVDIVPRTNETVLLACRFIIPVCLTVSPRRPVPPSGGAPGTSGPGAPLEPMMLASTTAVTPTAKRPMAVSFKHINLNGSRNSTRGRWLEIQARQLCPAPSPAILRLLDLLDAPLLVITLQGPPLLCLAGGQAGLHPGGARC